MEKRFKFEYNKEKYIYDCYYFEWIKKLFAYVSVINDAIETEEDEDLKNFLKNIQSTFAKFLYYMIKEEMAQSNENKLLIPLSIAVFQKENHSEIKSACLNRYIGSLNSNHFNELFTSFLYDFFINFWSDFENTITLLCTTIDEKIKNELKESNWKKIEKILKESLNGFENSEQILSEISKNKEKFTKKQFVSFSDKINYIFKTIKLDYDKNRNIKKDKEILDFGSKMRNTIHNNGKNKGENMELEIKGKKIILEQNKEPYYENFKDIFYLIDEIIDICATIIKTFKKQRKSTKTK